jgi:hypothetical protein
MRYCRKFKNIKALKTPNPLVRFAIVAAALAAAHFDVLRIVKTCKFPLSESDLEPLNIEL